MFTFLTDIFCQIDDFCNSFDKAYSNYFLTCDDAKRKKPCRISLSEIMTIMVLFHRSEHRTFKYFYLLIIRGSMKNDFPNAVSYERFVQLMEYALMPIFVFLSTFLIPAVAPATALFSFAVAAAVLIAMTARTAPLA